MSWTHYKLNPGTPVELEPHKHNYRRGRSWRDAMLSDRIFQLLSHRDQLQNGDCLVKGDLILIWINGTSRETNWYYRGRINKDITIKQVIKEYMENTPSRPGGGYTTQMIFMGTGLNPNTIKGTINKDIMAGGSTFCRVSWGIYNLTERGRAI